MQSHSWPGAAKLNYGGISRGHVRGVLGSLLLALFCGTASLPHILIRYYTVKDQVSARKSTVVGIAAIGAVTLGTRDGTVRELEEAVGAENLFLFGLGPLETYSWREGRVYRPQDVYAIDPLVRLSLDGLVSTRYAPTPGAFDWVREELLDLPLQFSGAVTDITPATLRIQLATVAEKEVPVKVVVGKAASTYDGRKGKNWGDNIVLPSASGP